MIDHFTLTVPDLVRSKEFYTRALEPLGYSVLMDFGEIVGFGAGQKPYFWLKAGPSGTQPMHMAFEAPSRTPRSTPSTPPRCEPALATTALPVCAANTIQTTTGLSSSSFERTPDRERRKFRHHLSPKRAAAKKSAPKKVAAKKSAAKKAAPKKSAPKKATRKVAAKRKPASKKRR